MVVQLTYSTWLRREVQCTVQCTRLSSRLSSLRSPVFDGSYFLAIHDFNRSVNIHKITFSSVKMSNSQASSIGSENFDGSSIVDEDNENFRTKNGTLWRKESKLGEGGYSEVYLYKNGGSTCAVKRMPNINAGGRMTPAELEKEKAALIKFSGRDHFVSFLGWFAESDIEYFVLEYVEFGDLESNLRRREKNRRKTLRKQGKTGREIKRAETCLPEAEVKTILTQILKGLEFLHADGYIHRDLKPQVSHNQYH